MYLSLFADVSVLMVWSSGVKGLDHFLSLSRKEIERWQPGHARGQTALVARNGARGCAAVSGAHTSKQWSHQTERSRAAPLHLTTPFFSTPSAPREKLRVSCPTRASCVRTLTHVLLWKCSFGKRGSAGQWHLPAVPPHDPATEPAPSDHPFPGEALSTTAATAAFPATGYYLSSTGPCLAAHERRCSVAAAAVDDYP